MNLLLKEEQERWASSEIKAQKPFMAERETTKQCKKSARESNESEEIRLIIKLATWRGGQKK